MTQPYINQLFIGKMILHLYFVYSSDNFIKKVSKYRPLNATNVYIIREKTVIVPNKYATKSNSNKAIKPQLIQPIIAIANAIPFMSFITYLLVSAGTVLAFSLIRIIL